MATKPFRGLLPGRPDGLTTLLRITWRDHAASHFLAKLERGRFSNIPVRSIEEAAAEARRLSALGADVYFACAEYRSHESRKASNAAAVWIFFLDIDCGEKKAAAGEGYSTTRIAREELSKCLAQMGIPAPTQVSNSGTGIHAYWALSKPLDPAKWQAVARKLKQSLAALGFRADPSRTADIASVMRLPGTLNHKYSPPLPVELIESSSEFLDTDAFCRTVEEAHSRLCRAPVVVTETPTPVDRDRRQYGPPDLAQLRTALSYLDPDCDEEIWKLQLIAPLARETPKYPELAEDLRKLAIDWSSGSLRGTPSRKWREPGGNNLTGEQIFPEVWDRFVHEPAREGPVFTLGTIFHAAKLAGAPLGALPDVIPGDALSYLQMRFALIVLSGDLYVIDLDQE